MTSKLSEAARTPEIGETEDGKQYTGGGTLRGTIPTPNGNWLIVEDGTGKLHKVWGGQPFWR
jgi:hypothetical protein